MELGEELPQERFDRLVLSGVLSFSDSGFLQFCHICKLYIPVVANVPLPMTHAFVDWLADMYSNHVIDCALKNKFDLGDVKKRLEEK